MGRDIYQMSVNETPLLSVEWETTSAVKIFSSHPRSKLDFTSQNVILDVAESHDRAIFPFSLQKKKSNQNIFIPGTQSKH